MGTRCERRKRSSLSHRPTIRPTVAPAAELAAAIAPKVVRAIVHDHRRLATAITEAFGDNREVRNAKDREGIARSLRASCGGGAGSSPSA